MSKIAIDIIKSYAKYTVNDKKRKKKDKDKNTKRTARSLHSG